MDPKWNFWKFWPLKAVHEMKNVETKQMDPGLPIILLNFLIYQKKVGRP